MLQSNKLTQFEGMFYTIYLSPIYRIIWHVYMMIYVGTVFDMM
jgi:hypothetical protein